jgi:hypothetical protein
MLHTATFAGGGLATAVLGGSSSRTAVPFLAGATFLAGGPFAAAGPVPALHFTVAFSYASMTFAFRTSARLSRSAFIGLSPTIFINVPKQAAVSSRAPAKPSSSSVERGSVTDLSWAGGSGIVEVERHLLKNLSEPSFTWGFLLTMAARISGMMSGRVV